MAKSGLRVLQPSEVLFNDGDPSNSLFIIQKGQLRLYKPKGRGFIEIAVLRTGEVIGEMAYFDDDGGGRRSCSASAMVTSEVIEISFTAFSKTMEGLNPWFKTIINTLANRLRKTNARVKELETNSVSLNYGGKQGEYEFFKTFDIIKILGTIFLIFKGHGKEHPLGTTLDKKTLTFYTNDIYSLMEVKVDSILLILQELGHLHIEIKEDESQTLVAKNIEMIRELFIHYNTERFIENDKRLKVSANCQIFLEKIYDKIKKSGKDTENVEIGIEDILFNFQERGQKIGIQHLQDASNCGICGEALTNGEEVRLNVNWHLLKKTLPIIRFSSALKKVNDEQGGTK